MKNMTPNPYDPPVSTSTVEIEESNGRLIGREWRSTSVRYRSEPSNFSDFGSIEFDSERNLVFSGRQNVRKLFSPFEIELQRPPVLIRRTLILLLAIVAYFCLRVLPSRDWSRILIMASVSVLGICWLIRECSLRWVAIRETDPNASQTVHYFCDFYAVIIGNRRLMRKIEALAQSANEGKAKPG